MNIYTDHEYRRKVARTTLALLLALAAIPAVGVAAHLLARGAEWVAELARLSGGG